jgi:hypothetical protein
MEMLPSFVNELEIGKYHVDTNIPCVEFTDDLATPPILGDHTNDLCVPCAIFRSSIDTR